MLGWAGSKAWERTETFQVAVGLFLIGAGSLLPVAVGRAAQGFLQADKMPLTRLSQRIYLSLGWQIEIWLRWWLLISLLLTVIGLRLAWTGFKNWKLSTRAVAKQIQADKPAPAEAEANAAQRVLQGSARSRSLARHREQSIQLSNSAIASLAGSLEGNYRVMSDARFGGSIIDLLALSERPHKADLIVEFKVVRTGFSASWFTPAIGQTDALAGLYAARTGRDVRAYLVIVLSHGIRHATVDRLRALVRKGSEGHNSTPLLIHEAEALTLSEMDLRNAIDSTQQP